MGRQRKEEDRGEKEDKATGQTAFNSASWKQHNVPHLRHDPFSAPRGAERGVGVKWHWHNCRGMNEWMKERMNEMYSILGDSWLERGTKARRCVSVKDVMIMKCSGPFLIPGFVHYSGPSLRSLCPIPLFPVCRHRAELVSGWSVWSCII